MGPTRLHFTAPLWLMLAASTLHAQRRIPAQQPPPGGELKIDTTGQRPAGPAPIVTVSATTLTTVTLRWEAVPGAMAYKVLRDPATKPEWLTPTPILPLSFGQPLTFTHTGVAPGTKISYAVWVEFAPASPYSMSNTTVTGQTLAPKNPSNFTATVALGDINLKWDSVPGAVFYAVWGSGMTNAEKVFGTTYPVKGVGAGTHQYTVIAYYDSVGRFGDEANPARATVTRKSGRYRITANGFQVNHQTNDHALNVDGWGDEVYVAAYVHAFSSTGTRGYLKQTGIYGGKKADEPFRIIVGSASKEGGLATGNTVPNTPTPWVRQEADGMPWEIWSGQLTEGLDVVVTFPALWEWDSGRDNFLRWESSLASVGPDIQLDTDGLKALMGGQTVPIRSATQKLRLTPWSGILGGGQDRPIGFFEPLKPPTFPRALWKDIVAWLWEAGETVTLSGGKDFIYPIPAVILTVDTIEQTLNNPSPKGAGVIELWLGEAPDLAGDYILYLQVERMP